MRWNKKEEREGWRKGEIKLKRGGKESMKKGKRGEENNNGGKKKR